MKLGRATARSSLAILTATVGIVVADLLGVFRLEVAQAFFSWAKTAPLLGDAIARLQAEPVAGAVLALFVGIVGFLLADKMAGLVDLRFDGDASKQFFRKDNGSPAYYLIQGRFLNHHPHEWARGVSARTLYWGYQRKLSALNRWASGVTPLATGFETHTATIDIPPNDVPARLNVALRWPTGTYAFSAENEHAHADMTHPDFALDPGTVLVRVRLKGERARETYWFSLRSGDQAPRLRPLGKIRAWVYWIDFAAWRLLYRATPPKSLLSGPAATPISLTEVTSGHSATALEGASFPNVRQPAPVIFEFRRESPFEESTRQRNTDGREVLRKSFRLSLRNHSDASLEGDVILTESTPRPASITTMQRLTIPGSDDGALRIPARGVGYVRVAYEDWLGPNQDLRRWFLSFVDTAAFNEIRDKETYRLTITARFKDKHYTTACCLGPDLLMGDALELWHGDDCLTAIARDRAALAEDAGRLIAGMRSMSPHREVPPAFSVLVRVPEVFVQKGSVEMPIRILNRSKTESISLAFRLIDEGSEHEWICTGDHKYNPPKHLLLKPQEQTAEHAGLTFGFELWRLEEADRLARVAALRAPDPANLKLVVTDEISMKTLILPIPGERDWT